jgi:hypothetical protein
MVGNEKVGPARIDPDFPSERLAIEKRQQGDVVECGIADVEDSRRLLAQLG